MAKYDPPRELREFHKEFMKLTGKYDTADVFCDFIDLMLTFFRYDGDKELGDRLKKKYKGDYEQLCICFQEMIHAYNKGLGSKNEFDWYDGVGSYYEVITSSYKSSRLGQFFTPPEVCDFMSAITIADCEADGMNVLAKAVSEPCCGSGRLVLATNKAAPGNYHYATDIDSVCVKMTAINMCLHAIRGQVVCADALQYGKTWRFGYEINRDLSKQGFPSLHDITQEQCFQSHVHENRIKDYWARVEKEQPKPEHKSPTQEAPMKVVETKQLSLF
jgi:type I restriction enzyme M protein